MAATDSYYEPIDKNQDTSSYDADYDKIKGEFDTLNPAAINGACTAWSRAARHIGQIANELLDKVGQPLHQAWQSKTSPDAQQQLQLAQATAAALADQCIQMANATDYAYQYAQWYKDHMPGTGMYHSVGGMLKDGADDQAAVDHLVRLLGRYNEVIATCVPSAVQAELVRNNAGNNVGTFRATPGPGPGPGSVHPTGPGPGPGLPTSPIGPGPQHPTTPFPTHPSTHDPLTPVGPGPGPGGTPIGPGHSGIPGLGSHPAYGGVDTGSSLAGFEGGAGGAGVGGLGGGLHPGGGLAGGASSGAGLAGGSGLAGGGAGAGGGLAGVGGIASGGAGAGRGGMMMPMHGAGNNDEEERERSTWLTEDDDVWGTSEASPGLIDG